MKAAAELIKGFQKGLKGFSHNISSIINFVLLGAVYAIGVGLTSIFAKLVGKHFLETEITKKETYWSNLGLKSKPLKDYHKQF